MIPLPHTNSSVATSLLGAQAHHYKRGFSTSQKDKNAVLKVRANAEMGTHKISSLQALLAHLWRSVIRNRRLLEDQETMYRFPKGMRPRLHPPLPQQYFGAPVQLGMVTMKEGELLKLGLDHAAWQLNKVISTYTETEASHQLLGILGEEP